MIQVGLDQVIIIEDIFVWPDVFVECLKIRLALIHKPKTPRRYKVLTITIVNVINVNS